MPYHDGVRPDHYRCQGTLVSSDFEIEAKRLAMGGRSKLEGGFTPSEQKLAEIAGKTFLSLWAYPNPYKDKRQHNKGDGKELCDLLVVCGNDIIIFSDKSGAWPSNDDINVSWCRWYKKIIEKSRHQVYAAARWIEQYPDRIYVDKDCVTPLPIQLPDPTTYRVHGVLIATGASSFIRKHCNDDSGTFMISSKLAGVAHMDPSDKGFAPLTIGDINPDGFFIHVFDSDAIDIVMRHRNTVTDFIDYLNSRAHAIRRGVILAATGEEDMLAHYLQSEDKYGRNSFVGQKKKLLKKNYGLVLLRGTWEAYVARFEYFIKHQADEISFLWDGLIELFARHAIDGTGYTYAERESSIHYSEQGLRIMALESRISRRSLGQALKSTKESALAHGVDRYTRVLIPQDRETVAYVLFFIRFIERLHDNDYNSYRELRLSFLEAYSLAIFERYPHIDTVVSLGFDYPDQNMRGESEDMMAISRDGLPDDYTDILAEFRKIEDIFPDNLPIMRYRVFEYVKDALVTPLDKEMHDSRKRKPRRKHGQR